MNENMNEIMIYIYKIYGYRLSSYEVNEFIQWYKSNKYLLINNDVADTEIRRYFCNKYPNKTRRILNEQDFSSLEYFLGLLSKETGGK